MSAGEIKFVSQAEFDKNPELKAKFGDYQKFLNAYVQQLKETPVFSAKDKFNLKFLPNSIRDSIWARSKQADLKKEESEETYTLAVRAEREAKIAQDKAEKHLEKMIASYQEGDSHITDAENKLRDLMKGTSSAELARELAGEHLVADSKASLRAFQSGMIADAMINYRG